MEDRDNNNKNINNNIINNDRFNDIFYKVFKSTYLIQCIFKHVRGKRLICLGSDGNLPADPLRTFAYKDIRSVHWMIENSYFGLLKDKLARRQPTSTINSIDIALMCKKCAPSSPAEIVPLPQLPFKFDNLVDSHFYLTPELFEMIFSSKALAELTECPREYLQWLGDLPFVYWDIQSLHRRDWSLPDSLASIKELKKQIEKQKKCINFVSLNTIDMIDYIESKFFDPDLKEKRIKEYFVQKVPPMDMIDEKEYKWVYMRWIIESKRFKTIRDKDRWVENWQAIYYQDRGNKVWNDIIRRAIKNHYTNPHTPYLLCPDETPDDNDDTPLENYQQVSSFVAVRHGYLAFTKKLYQIYTPSDDVRDINNHGYVNQLGLLNTASEHNQVECAKWIIEQIKTDTFAESVKVEHIQIALETAMSWGHYEITDLILSQFPDTLFTTSLLEVAATSGNIEFFKSLLHRVKTNYLFVPLQRTLLNAMRSGSMELVLYILQQLLKLDTSSLSYSYFTFIHTTVRNGHFEITKMLLTSLKKFMNKDSISTMLADIIKRDPITKIL
ncbi:hypothetical protein DFA_08598 [Cavenderia fasciculata]|uniref:Ankyrin repeat-containing protein n=1 Tax=Cavenderia fasciculata TaxID=261658 RepID=F4Q392_CACFS|nr:uncharacterized protein DFA_08598 [Cavenderia fasciculata]EGG17602.1 hypothetical protein DFA_08598 [Cavenderia fasciculata]|eukprot:XP_004356086.1 hypothetical protein DFA_08598 [Cavenderia fasciculata]